MTFNRSGPVRPPPAAPDRALAAMLREVGDEARIGLAVSGGVDSMALLLAAADSPARSRCVVLHVDHALREESACDRRFVERVAAERGLAVAGTRAAVDPRPGGLEARARAARYAALAEMARVRGLAVVMTAQHRDDQRETTALALWRGAPATQARGMPRARPLSPSRGATRLVRPFLELGRDVLAQRVLDAGTGWREDLSNRDVARRRNLLRHVLLPRLEAEHPGALTRLDALAARAARIDVEVARRAARLADAFGGLELAALLRAPDEVARRALESGVRRAVERSARPADPHAAVFGLRRVVARRILDLGDGGAVQVAPDLRVLRRAGILSVEVRAVVEASDREA